MGVHSLHTILDSFSCQRKEIRSCIYKFLFKERIFTKTIHYQIVLDSKRLQLGLHLFPINDAEHKVANGRLIAAKD